MTSTNETSQQYRIPEANFAALTAKIEKITRRAVKLGTEAVKFEVTGHDDVPVLHAGKPTGEVTRYLLVTVTGKAPQVAGWTFVATLEHAGEEAGTIIRTVPGVETKIPVSFRSANPSHCDHCHTRRVRKDTFLVVNAQGEFKQIGRNCLCDFLGGHDPQGAARGAEYLFDIDESAHGAEGFGGGAYRYDLGLFLAFVAAAIRAAGWLSRGKARELNEADACVTATADVAFRVMIAKGREKDKIDPKFFPAEADYTQAEASLAWVKETIESKPTEDRTDYEHNLVVVTKQQAIEPRGMGIAASAVQGFIRATQRAAEAKARQEAGKASEFVGEVGVRSVFFVKSLGEPRAFEGQFGTTYLYKLVTQDGAMLTWFASGGTLDALVTDAFVAVMATVKKHEDYKGTKQTVVSRLAIATQKQIDKATGADKAKKAQAKAEKDLAKRLAQKAEQDW